MHQVLVGLHYKGVDQGRGHRLAIHRQNACQGDVAHDSVGVYLAVKNPGMTKFFFDTITLKSRTVMSLEPVPVTCTCDGWVQVMPGIRLPTRTRRDERGYVAVFSVLLLVVMMAMAAFTVDVGNWYVTSQQNQRAADAAALAGVTFMPASFSDASAAALQMASRNGLAPGAGISVTPATVAGQNSRLQVTVSKTVKNAFGGLFGVSSTTVTRSAIAAFTGPVPMGSPCNEFGNDPTPGTNKSTNCDTVGQFWANVGSPRADKASGDAYQNGACPSNGDGCASNKNKEYDENGYFYTLTVKTDMPLLTVEAFDPAFISVGDTCGENLGSGTTAAVNAKNSFVYDATITARTPNRACTGRVRARRRRAATPAVPRVPSAPATSCSARARLPTRRSPSASRWQRPTRGTRCPMTRWADRARKRSTATPATCTPSSTSGSRTPSNVVRYTANTPTPASAYDATIAGEFRRWVPLCTMTNVKKGTYMIQVQTNGPGADLSSNGHNRFGLRAYGANATENGNIAVAGYTKMAVYANLPGAHDEFYLAQVPPTAKGQNLNVRLFDVGDSSEHRDGDDPAARRTPA